MVIAKTVATALSRCRCNEGHSPNRAACAQRRLQVQQQLGAEDHQPKRKLRDHQQAIPQFPNFIPSMFVESCETLVGKGKASHAVCNKVLAD